AFAKDDTLLLIPVLIGDARTPADLRSFAALRSADLDPKTIATEIDRSLTAFASRRELARQERVVSNERLQANAADYVEEAITRLRANETRDRRIAVICYALGLITLLAGVTYGYRALSLLPTSSTTWLSFAFATLKTFVVVGLLIAASKYS